MKVKIAKLLLIGSLASLTIAPLMLPQSRVFAQAPAAAPKMPQNWDPSIPLPDGAVLLDSSVPKTGVVDAADFSVKGDYKSLVDFYEKELPKAGFELGPKVAIPARKVYNRNFSRGAMLNSVVVSPNPADPSKFNVHVAWSPEAAKPKSAAP